MYNYQIFEAKDGSNSRVEAARRSFGKENVACYVISKNNVMQMIQFAGEEPYPGESLASSAALHIAALEAENNLSEKAPPRELVEITNGGGTPPINT